MPHKAHYTSTNEILNVGLRLLENTTLNFGDTSLTFQFQLPQDALPSYIGSFASVSWKLSAKADIPWHTDLSDQGYLLILTVRPENPIPITVENQETRPKVRLELPSNILEPGETIFGKLTILDPGNLHNIRLQIIQHEDATARGTLNNAHKSQNQEAGPIVEIRTDALGSGSTTFRLQLPESAPCTYRGVYSWITWYVEAILDIPNGEDDHLYAPFTVGLRAKPAPQTVAPQITTVEVSASTILERAEPRAALEPPSSASEIRKIMEARAAIIEILSDGSSKDLITIGTELQQKTQAYLNIEQVRKLCEDLVSEGRLTRTAEGEFFAKYSIKTPGFR